MNTIPEYLDSTCAADICRDPQCKQAVKQDTATGRWFITMGHPGFNSPANNGLGYSTRALALAATARYGRPRKGAR